MALTIRLHEANDNYMLKEMDIYKNLAYAIQRKMKENNVVLYYDEEEPARGVPAVLSVESVQLLITAEGFDEDLDDWVAELAKIGSVPYLAQYTEIWLGYPYNKNDASTAGVTTPTEKEWDDTVKAFHPNDYYPYTGVSIRVLDSVEEIEKFINGNG